MPVARQQQGCARSLSFERFSSKIRDIEKIILLMEIVLMFTDNFVDNNVFCEKLEKKLSAYQIKLQHCNNIIYVI